MSGRSTQYGSGTDFVVGHPWALDPGRQIDWANVSTDFLNSATGKKEIPAGTAMGEKIDLDASGSGKISPRVDTTNPAIGLLVGTAVQDDRSAALSGYGLIRGANVYEALLPDATGTPPVLPPDIKAELVENGSGFLFTLYQDVRS